MQVHEKQHEGRTECQGRKAAPLLDGQTHPFFSNRAAHRTSIEALQYFTKFVRGCYQIKLVPKKHLSMPKLLDRFLEKGKYLFNFSQWKTTGFRSPQTLPRFSFSHYLLRDSNYERWTNIYAIYNRAAYSRASLSESRRHSITIAAACVAEVSSARKHDKTDGKPFMPSNRSSREKSSCGQKV